MSRKQERQRAVIDEVKRCGAVQPPRNFDRADIADGGAITYFRNGRIVGRERSPVPAVKPTLHHGARSRESRGRAVRRHGSRRGSGSRGSPDSSDGDDGPREPHSLAGGVA